MVVLLLFFVYVFVLSLAFGWGILSFLKKHNNISVNNLPLISVVGLAAITTLGSIFSIFFRINWEFQIVLLVVAIILFILTKPYKELIHVSSWSRIDWLYGVLSIVVLLVILYASSLVPANPDTSIYHAQAIHWIEEYPVIPGLANLHARFGYNSNWLLLNAIFSFSFLKIQSFHFMTGFFFFVGSLYFLSGIKNGFLRKTSVSDIVKIGFLAALFIFLFDQSSSPGTDAPSTLFVWILNSETVRLLENGKKISSKDFWTTAFLAVFTCTIKISVFPILLLAIPAVFPIFKERISRQTWVLAGLVGLVVLPFLARNVILTGYLVFPGPAIDLFKFDWRIPANILSEESRTIHSFAALPNMDQAQFYSLTAREWIPIWFSNQIPRHKAILAVVLVMPAVFLILLAAKPWRIFVKANRFLLLPLCTAYLGIVFWFLAAPAFRFGYGFLLGAIVLDGSLILRFFLGERKRLNTVLLILLIPGFLFVIGLSVIGLPKPTNARALVALPVDYPDWSTAPCEFGNFTILCQVNYDACWYSAFPCAIKGEKNVEMRGADFRQGFRNLDNQQR